MRHSLASLALLSFSALPLASAIKLAIKPRSTKTGAVFGTTVSNPDTDQINNINNERYTADILINGQEVTVMLDTGSTDLWVKPPQGIGKLNQTTLTANLTYGDGTDFVFGHIGIAPLEFGGYTIPQQAFVNAEHTAEAEDADFEEGIFGLLGLSFDSDGASRVNDAVTTAYGKNATWGQSVLANIFAQHPDKENFISVSLSRTDDLEGTAAGSLNVGEYDEKYPEVAKAPHIPLVSSGSWNILLDGLIVNGKSIKLKSAVPGLAAGKQVSLLDSGTTNVMLASAYINAIYGQIPGARLAKDTTVPSLKFSTDSDVWVVPCLADVSVSAVFGGQEYPIHPLDLTDMHQVTAPNGNNYTICTGTFTNIGDIGGETWDGLWGASFLRNTYTVYDFGDSVSTRDPTDSAFMQLSSLTNHAEAAKDLTNVRKKTLQGMAKELHPDALIALYKGADKESLKEATKSSGEDDDEEAVDAYNTADEEEAEDDVEPNADEDVTEIVETRTAYQTAAAETTAAVETTATIESATIQTATTAASISSSVVPTSKANTLAGSLESDDVSTNSDPLKKWGPIIAGLLGANLVVGLVLLVLGIVTCVRKGGRAAPLALRSLSLSGASGSYAPVRGKHADVEEGKDERFEGGRLYGQ